MPRTPSPQPRSDYTAAAEPFSEGVSFRPAATAPRPPGPQYAGSSMSSGSSSTLPSQASDGRGASVTLALSKPSGRRIGWRIMVVASVTIGNMMLAAYPLWSAVAMLHDPACAFFVGQQLPTLTLVVCAIGALGFALVVGPALRSVRDHSAEQTVITFTAMVLCALGIGFLLLSYPLSAKSAMVHRELYFDCQYGPHTQRLYENAQELQLLRATPACALQNSIETCDGFGALNVPALTGFLKSMELQYGCAGFCYQDINLTALAGVVARQSSRVSAASSSTKAIANSTRSEASSAAGHASASSSSVTGATTKAPAMKSTTPQEQQHAAQLQLAPGSSQRASGGPGGALRRSGTPAEPPARQGVSLSTALQRLAQAPQRPSSLADLGEVSAQEPDLGDTVAMLQLRAHTLDNVMDSSAARQPGKVGGYPPTLFSRADSKVSCDGAAGRALKYEAGDAGTFLYWEGLALLVVAVLANVLRMGALCLEGLRCAPAEAEPKAVVPQGPGRQLVY